MASILFKVVRICNSQFKCNYLKNDKFFLHFLFHFLILPQILNTLKEKIILIANVFPKLKTVKIFVRKLSQEHLFTTGFGSQHVKASQMLAKFPWELFYHVFLSFWVKLIWKMYPQVLCEILTVLLTHWLPMGSILFKVVRICKTQFKCNYLKNDKLFLIFYSNSWIYIQF